ncbi:MAG: DNA repair protein RecN [Actinomycetota bacterium]|nr:DNA repair protein RecN [Actinomycetota bacterium]
MIEEIRIRALGVIEEALLELGPGLSVITGETGAGKTMLVTALGLLLGNRADPGTVRSGSTAARIEGVVRADGSEDRLADAVGELGGEVEDDRVLLVRQIQAEGRSRAYVGGTTVPASALTRLADQLVAVHGQSDQHRLLNADAQRQALDRYAGDEVAAPLREYAEIFVRHRMVESALRKMRGASRERAREADALRFGLAEIEAARPQPGEDLALAAEESRLGASDTLRAAAELAREELSGEVEHPDALGAVAAARQALEGVREYDAGAGLLADRVAEVSYLLADVAADVASYSAGVDTDPARLAAVSERRAALTALTRRYGETIDEVLVWARDSAARLVELDGSEDRLGELGLERDRLRDQLAGLAARISQARSSAAVRLAQGIAGELHALAMPAAKVSVEVSQRADDDGLAIGTRRLRFTAAGVDEVELLLVANAGAKARPLHRGASGGELSRVMLAIEVVLAATSPVPTFVFDEVDSGVGGKAAVEVGRRLAVLARTAQVLVVTHLPQVAAFADHHVVVRKADDGTVTTSGVTVLDDGGRVRELSRMLAGLEQSDTAMAHAEELLEMARQGR